MPPVAAYVASPRRVRILAAVTVVVLCTLTFVGWFALPRSIRQTVTVSELLTLLALLTAGPLMRLIGAKLEAMITRILGVILAALATQFVIDGIERSFT